MKETRKEEYKKRRLTASQMRTATRSKSDGTKVQELDEEAPGMMSLEHFKERPGSPLLLTGPGPLRNFQ